MSNRNQDKLILEEGNIADLITSVNNINQLMFVFNKDLDLVSVNENAKEFYLKNFNIRIKPDTTAFNEIFQGETYEILYNELIKAKEKKFSSGEIYIIINNQKYWFNYHVNPITLRDNNIYISLCLFETTENKIKDLIIENYQIKLDNIYKNLTSGIIIYHKEKGVVDLNDFAAKEILKIKNKPAGDEIVKIKWYNLDKQLISPKEHPAIEYFNDKLNYSRIIGTKEGNIYRWWSVEIQQYIPDQSDIIIINLTEITDILTLNHALKESEERYRSIYNHVQIGIGLYSPDGLMISLNKTALAHFGKKVNEVHGKKITDIFPGKFGKEFLDLLHETVNTGKIVSKEININERKINRKMSFIFTPVYNENGKIDNIQVIGRDITKEIETLNKLKESNELFETLFKLSPFGIAILSPKGKIINVNKAFLTLSGFSFQELIEKTLFNIPTKPRPFISDVSKIFSDILRGKQVSPIRFSWTHKNGEKRLGMAYVSVFKKAGKIENVIVLVKDITVEELYENRILEEKDKALELVESSGVIFVKLNINGIVEYVNSYSLELLECELVDIKGKNWFDNFLLPEEKDVVFDVFKKIVAGNLEEVKTFNNYILTKRGNKKFIKWFNSYIKNEHDEIVYVISSGTDISRENELFEEKQKSELMVKSILENSPDAVFISETPYTEFVYVNPKGINLLGCEQSDIVLRKKPEDIFINKNDFYDIVNKSDSTSEKKTVFIKNKNNKKIACELKVIYLPDGKFFIHLHDISKRYFYETELEKTNRKLNNLINNQGEGIAIVDEHENLIFVNPAACEIFNDSENNLIGRNLREFVSENTFEMFQQQTKQREKGEKNSYEFELILKNGEKKFILLTATPNFDENNKFAGTFGIFRDITKQKNLEKKLIRTNENLENFLKSLPGVAYRCYNDEYYTMIFLSDSCKKITGYSKNELLFNNVVNFIDIIHPEDRKTVVEMINNAVRNNRQYNLTYRIIKKDGTIRWVWEKGHATKERENNRQVLIGYIEDITVNKEIEKNLVDSEARFREFTELLPQSVFEIDLNGNFTFINKFAYEMFGFTYEEFIRRGNNIKIVFPSEEYEKVLKNMQTLLKEQKPQTNEYVCVKKDGTLFPVLVSSVLIKKDGKPYAIRGINVDITEQKKREEKINELYEQKAIQTTKTEMLLEATKLMLKKHDFNTVATYIYESLKKLNGATQGYIALYQNNKLKVVFYDTIDENTLNNKEISLKLHGFKKMVTDSKKTLYINDFKQTKWYKKLPPNHPEIKNVIISPFYLQDKLLGVISYINKPGGFDNKDVELIESFGEILSLSLFHSNLYEKLNEANKKLKKNLERLSSIEKITKTDETNIHVLLDMALEEAIKITNSKIGYIFYYDEEKELFTLNSLSKDVMKQCTVKNLQTKNQLKNTGCWGEVVRQRKPIIINDYNPENPYVKGTPDGHVKLKRFMSVPVFSGNRIVAVAGVANKKEPYTNEDVKRLDVFMHTLWKVVEKHSYMNELEVAKAKAEEASHFKSMFLSNLTHEIRTPLNSIIGFSELLIKQDFTKEELNKFLNIIYNSGKQLNDLISDLSDLSKIEKNQIDIDDETFSLNNLMQETEAILLNDDILLSKKLELKFDHYQQKEIFIKSDKNRLRQILANLIKNAIKFTEKGSISVSYKPTENKEILFIVKDTGIGIEAKHLNRVFERHYQVKNNLTASNKGFGLGLAITKMLVEKMGGKIWVESKPNEGSVFYFTLPYGDNEANKSSYDKKIDVDKLVKNKKILIVEDDIASLEYYKNIFENLSVKVFYAETGEKALEIFENNQDIDIAFIDINLPGIDGTIVMQKIKEKNKNIPAIAQTAFAMSDEKEIMLKKGFDDILPKPISQNDIFIKLKKYFD